MRANVPRLAAIWFLGSARAAHKSDLQFMFPEIDRQAPRQIEILEVGLKNCSVRRCDLVLERQNHQCALLVDDQTIKAHLAHTSTTGNLRHHVT